MCPTKRGSRPDEDIIDLMDVMEDDPGLQDGASPRTGKGEADILLLDDVVAEEPADEDVLELTEALDENAGRKADDDVLDLTDMLDENVGSLTGEGVLELTDALDDDNEDLGADPVSRASTEEISSAGRESDDEIDLAELDELLKDIENEDALAGDASKDESGDISLQGLSGTDQEIDLADIDSLLRELEEDGGDTEADLIPAGLEPQAVSKPEPGAATVEYILSGLEDKPSKAPSTELHTMKVAVQPEPLAQAGQAEAEELARPAALGGLGDLSALHDDEELAELLADDEDKTLSAQEDADQPASEEDDVAVEAEAQNAAAVELPSAVPDFHKSPVPEIPVGLVDWQATAAFASTRGPRDLLREPEEAPKATPRKAPAVETQTVFKPAATPASEQRLGWRIEALETLVRDELAKARTLADRMADVEVYVMAAPKPEEWTELMEAVSALRSAPPVPSAPSVTPEEISVLRERLSALESEQPQAPAIPAEVQERLAHIEELAGQVGSRDIEDLRQTLEMLGQRLDALPSTDLDELQRRLTELEERPQGLTQEDLTPLFQRLDDLNALASRLADVETSLAGKTASDQLIESVSTLRDRIAALESRPVLDETAQGNLDDLRQKLSALQTDYESLAPAAALVSSVAAMADRVAALESRVPEVADADLRHISARLEELAARLDGDTTASTLPRLEERLVYLESLEAGNKSAASEAALSMRTLSERMEALETRLQSMQAERLAELEKRLTSMETGLASRPATPSMAEIVAEAAGRVEDKVFDRVEIVLSGRMIDQIERLENSLPEQIEEVMAKRQPPAPPAVDEEALAARMTDRLSLRLERQMAVQVEQLLSARLKTFGRELETALAESLEAPLTERLESSFADRFGAELRDKLEEFLEGTVKGSLRDELMSEIQRALPKATARIVREEIEALKRSM